MHTACIPQVLAFPPLKSRRVEAAFDGGHVTSDSGLLLLRDLATRIAFFEQVADCFVDYRAPERVEFSIRELVAQRLLAIACGYEDVNDHDKLRHDPMFAVAVDRVDPLGRHRRYKHDRGRGLASASTIHRLETAAEALDDKRPDLKVFHRPELFEALFVDLFLDAHDEAPDEIVLDVDATDDPLHGNQEGRFFHAYYDGYCYLPLYVFCGDFLLVAKLRQANQDGAAGALEELQRVVAHIRRRWPKTRIVIRGDSGFCRDALMTWCEETDRVDFVLGVARNKRLRQAIETEMVALNEQVEETGKPAKTFAELRYRTLTSWSAERRVVAKVERLVGKENPRFVATSLTIDEADAERLYTEVYCARGDMENRIKEQQLGLFADRTSTQTMRSNQLRLWLSSLAYVLINELRRVGLRGTPLEKAQAWSIRTLLLKIGALVRVSVRRIRVALSSGHPLQDVFCEVHDNIRAAYPMVF